MNTQQESVEKIKVAKTVHTKIISLNVVDLNKLFIMAVC